MDAGTGYSRATANSPPSHARFYGDVGDAGVGAGMLLANVEYPTYLADNDTFAVVRGLVVVLTHECDLDQDNERLLNDSALICPVIPLEQFVEGVSEAVGDELAAQFIGNITARYVNRVMYIPMIPNVLPLGGYLYFNLLTNTSFSRVTENGAESVAMLSVDGLLELDLSLEQHLRRPKSDRIPFQQSHAAEA